MNRRKKYRFFVICCLALDLLAIFWLGYKYLDRKIPDEIQISRDSGKSTEDVMSRSPLRLRTGLHLKTFCS